MRWGYLRTSPAAGADKPREATGRAEYNVWTGAQVDAFLSSLKEDRLFSMWRLFVTSGMRKGEVLGLQWADIDLDAARCSISRARVPVGGAVVVDTSKSARSRRSIALDPETVEAIREYKRPLLEKSLAAQGTWDVNGWVFTSPHGKPLDPARVARLFKKAVEESGVPTIRLHDMRHTVASLGLAAGVNPKLISELLGHASTSFTLDRYSHVIPASQTEMASTIASLIRPDEDSDVDKMLTSEG